MASMRSTTDPNRTVNRKLYDRFWKRMPVTPPQWFATWKLLRGGIRNGQFVEIGPGTRPRAPLNGTVFLDLSFSALKKLREEGGQGSLADGGRLPLRAGCADRVVAFDVLEHVKQDKAFIREIGRVLRTGGEFFFSVPLHPSLYDRFDRVAGHYRRYEPSALVQMLRETGFGISTWCAFGSRPRSGVINWAGAWWMERYPAWCAWTRDAIFRIFGRYFQGEIRLREGDLSQVGLEVAGVVVRARKEAAGGESPEKGAG
ncbi:MAG: class I SAM-dependent methyltransferase [Planctomycetota bacterium]|jgi:SAM-dependent methyltransferase